MSVDKIDTFSVTNYIDTCMTPSMENNVIYLSNVIDNNKKTINTNKLNIEILKKKIRDIQNEIIMFETQTQNILTINQNIGNLKNLIVSINDLKNQINNKHFEKICSTLQIVEHMYCNVIDNFKDYNIYKHVINEYQICRNKLMRLLNK